MANLSDLPGVMLTEIAMRLKKFEDYVSFRSVSKSLREAAKEEYFEGIRLLQHTPYLMLPVREGNDDIREFYSLGEYESIVASVKVPKFKSKKCLESLGWLLVSEVDGSASLLNPFSGVEITLPHQNTFPGYESVEMDEMGFFEQMVLSSRPNEAADFVLMVIGGGMCELAFWRPGDKAWNKIEPYFGIYTAIVYYGGGQFCAVGSPALVWAFNVSGSDNQIESRVVANFMPENRTFNVSGSDNQIESPVVANFMTENRTLGYIEDFEMKRHYVLKNDNDDSLLLITRTKHFFSDEEGDQDFAFITKKFQVYKVDMVTGTWKEIYSLGSMAVFLGHNSTTAVDASRFPGTVIKANHIYFTDDNWIFYTHEDNEHGGGWDTGVYNLETGTVEPVYPGEPLLSKVSPSTWITPCF